MFAYTFIRHSSEHVSTLKLIKLNLNNIVYIYNASLLFEHLLHHIDNNLDLIICYLQLWFSATPEKNTEKILIILPGVERALKKIACD